MGWGQASLPLRDNLHTAELFVEVDPAARRVGVGTALVRALEAQAREAGRHTLLSWTTHSEEADPADPDALTAPTGVGSLRSSDPSAAFALGHGYRLEQTERHSQLDVPVPAEVLDPLRRRAEDAAGGYRVLTWTGPTPPEHRAGMARLHQRMSVDVPTADLEIGEEVWDVERVVRSDERAVRMGRTVLTAVAQHVASGELVAYTLLFCPQEDEAVAWQGDTLVHGEHRGHRLGLLVKVANLDQLARQRPGTRRIHTWNAGENQWMLAINVALGFRRVATEGAWQKRLRS
nr:GNAT family N-acetyltransferase [Auraticoccus cholistanensis]